MKTEIIINGVKYNLDIQKAKELGILEEENTRCKSWEEFKSKYENKKGFFYNTDSIRVDIIDNPVMTVEQLTENEAIAIKAFSKLLKLRRDWIGDWEPDWCVSKTKYCIIVVSNCLTIACFRSDHHVFSFPTKEMAQEFLESFNDLFNQCKNIL